MTVRPPMLALVAWLLVASLACIAQDAPAAPAARAPQEAAVLHDGPAQHNIPAAQDAVTAEPVRPLAGPFTPNGGHAFLAVLPADVPGGDTAAEPHGSALVLLEDGRELGPAHASHGAIRELGAGRYSHWETALYFSTPDGSDPATNGRQYAFTLRAAVAPDGAVADDELAAVIAADLLAELAGDATGNASGGSTDPAKLHTARVQAALDFVHDNSVHRIDEQHDREAFDTPRMLRALWAVHTDAGSERPPLSCGPRAYALQALLSEMGLTSRLVQVFSTRGAQVGAHRFVEVLDPSSARWEAWDPDHAVSYVDARSGERVGADRLVLGGPDVVVPRRGELSGWEPLGLAWLGGHDFAAVLFESFERAVGMRDPLILHDPRRFDPDRRFADGETFRDWAQRHFGTCRYVPVAVPR